MSHSLLLYILAVFLSRYLGLTAWLWKCSVNRRSINICLCYNPFMNCMYFMHLSFGLDIWITAKILPFTLNISFIFKKELSTRDINLIIPWVCLIDILHTWMKSDGLCAVSLSCDLSKSLRREDLFTYFSILKEAYSQNPLFSLSE